ncbi:flavodoxin family protein [Sphingomonas japonica]|uniref:Multimeric flavodoxin WrbA n=1 Tax=Sphingomonas japonica TaxID=511662 RepID=A0ABX0U0H0_9SPHN|nr:NAD(P)H-dependent oxidoreductase [Sphingomonas japonica]NIJ24074.1 multimeric flavodoxin WrbA [Sphingomonas japonica]
MNPPLVIEGSARQDGDTAQLVRGVRDRLDASVVVSLSQIDIAPFAYGATRQPDDFAAVIDAMLASDDIVFATPVYWYAMSGRMKTVFDRLTDLLHDDRLKPRARAFAGRRTWLLAVGTDPALPPGFAEPFARTSRYLGMNWSGAAYFNTRGDVWMGDAAPALNRFIGRIRIARGRA